jgi:tRNA(Ile)-lysidine synthase
LLENGITARQDSSNVDAKHMRNRLRHEIIPLLRSKVNPHADRHLAALAGQARQIYRQISRKAKAALEQLQPTIIDENMGVIQQGTLLKLSDDVLQDVLLRCWFAFGLPMQAMNRARWKEVMEVCRGTRPQVQLPGGVLVRRKIEVIQFLPGKLR